MLICIENRPLEKRKEYYGNHIGIRIAAQTRAAGIVPHPVPGFRAGGNRAGAGRAVAVSNAELKADAAAEVFPDALVIGADTVIELEHSILGKPSGRENAEQMLLRMSGRSHNVVTGVCMACRNRQIRICFADVSKVFFKEIGLETIRHYMSLVNVMDKAGAYAVQEHGELIIDRVEGSVNNVIGLPVERIAETLRLNGLL